MIQRLGSDPGARVWPRTTLAPLATLLLPVDATDSVHACLHQHAHLTRLLDTWQGIAGDALPGLSVVLKFHQIRHSIAMLRLQ